MRCGLSSTRSASANPSCANFVAEYAPKYGSPRRPAADEMITTCPRKPSRFSCFAITCTFRIAANHTRDDARPDDDRVDVLIAGGHRDIPGPGLSRDEETALPPARPGSCLKRQAAAAAERNMAVGEQKISTVRMILG